MQQMQKPTKQEMKLYAIQAAVVGLAGGIAAVWTLMSFGGTITRQMSGEVFILLAMFGAFCAGFAVSPWLGRGGGKGALLSFASFLGATFIGAWIAGMLGLEPRNYDMVAMWLMIQFLTPGVVLWVALWGATHCAGVTIRRKLT